MIFFLDLLFSLIFFGFCFYLVFIFYFYLVFAFYLEFSLSCLWLLSGNIFIVELPFLPFMIYLLAHLSIKLICSKTHCFTYICTCGPYCCSIVFNFCFVTCLFSLHSPFAFVIDLVPVVFFGFCDIILFLST